MPDRPHDQRDRLIVAQLQGASSKHAGWKDPEGDARTKALAELREIATQDGRLRTDLLAETAGVCQGFAERGSEVEAAHRTLQAKLLIEAGADVDLLEEWTAVGRERATRAEDAMRRGGRH